MKSIKIFCLILIILLVFANFDNISKRFSLYLQQDHSDIGIDTIEGEVELYSFGKEKTMTGEDDYYIEPTISFKERVFCRGGIGKSADCKERPLNPYWVNWELDYGSPDDEHTPGGVAKQEYERRYKGREVVKRVK
jgi:hypothetical protein